VALSTVIGAKFISHLDRGVSAKFVSHLEREVSVGVDCYV
jgi:hypothetical protein